MVSKREHSLLLLGAIRVALERPGPLRLTNNERDYLIRACDRALVGNVDPLDLGRPKGGQQDGARLMAEALAVHERIKSGATLRSACEWVGRETHRDGSKSGAVEKNYRSQRTAIEAADRFYAARNAGRPPGADDLLAMLAGKERGK